MRYAIATFDHSILALVTTEAPDPSCGSYTDHFRRLWMRGELTVERSHYPVKPDALLTDVTLVSSDAQATGGRFSHMGTGWVVGRESERILVKKFLKAAVRDMDDDALAQLSSVIDDFNVGQSRQFIPPLTAEVDRDVEISGSITINFTAKATIDGSAWNEAELDDDSTEIMEYLIDGGVIDFDDLVDTTEAMSDIVHQATVDVYEKSIKWNVG